MADSSDHFGSFEDHTLLKHTILRAYLTKWAAILLKSGKFGPSVCFFDAFAGPGKDKQGNEGSPLIAIHAALAVRAMARADTIRSGGRLRLTFGRRRGCPRRHKTCVTTNLPRMAGRQARPEEKFEASLPVVNRCVLGRR